jgi:ATP-binding cassette subfamily B protein
LLRLGEIQHSDGQRLTPGNIYVNAQQGSWQVTQPTIVYSLKNADWQAALEHWPQLAELIDFQERQGS